MPLTTKRSTPKKNSTTLDNIRIRRSNTQTIVPMLTSKIAPAGTYASRIAAVTASKIENSSADAVDITYELTDSSGKVVQGRLRYEIGGYHFDRLGDALIDAGLPNGSSIVDAVGIEEEIELIYPYRGALAKIKSRRPLEAIVAPKKAVAKPEAPADDGNDEDDEYDDFLPDDEEDF